jgi:hypothetical protein
MDCELRAESRKAESPKARKGRRNVLWLLLVVCGCGESPAGNGPAPRASVLDNAAIPALVDLEGREVKIAGEAGVKATALVFVLPDCPICNAYIPELNRLHESFVAQDVRMMLVHADTDVSAEEAREHAREYRIRAPVVLDPQHDWVKKAGATTAPEAVVFSPVGEVLYRGRIDNQYAGLGKRRAVVTSHDLQVALEAIVAGQPIAEARTEAIGCPIPERSRGD